ncbi:MAG: FKBP-type peptidyl-prolyl cis-trans isomerase [Bdellovibrionales bacterium]|nr:FKBP-type peptidyl-prolyl cis-trans isomerase [Bdellovibrionales bacterium]
MNSGCTPGAKSPKTDKEKYSYVIGYQFSKNLKSQSVDIDSGAFIAAMQDVMSGKPAQIKEEEMAQVMQKMYEERTKKMSSEAGDNLKKGKDWLVANKKNEGVVETASGLQYKVVSPGNGAQPKATDVVVVHYRGTLLDGTEFDSSIKRNQPAEFPLNAVIKGWTEGLQLMKKGAKYMFYIPPELAYGEQGRPSIPGNSVLQFEVELIDIKGAPAETGKEMPHGKKPSAKK